MPISSTIVSQLQRSFDKHGCQFGDCETSCKRMPLQIRPGRAKRNAGSLPGDILSWMHQSRAPYSILLWSFNLNDSLDCDKPFHCTRYLL